MKRRFRTSLILAGVMSIALAVAKLFVPFGYAERPLSPEAVAFVSKLQSCGEQDPELIAERYLFFGTDYQFEVPDRITVTSNRIGNDMIRVRIYDPSCMDDSIHSSIDRVYLRRENSGQWMPTRVEWSHKGRGRFGWTTKPTT